MVICGWSGFVGAGKQMNFITLTKEEQKIVEFIAKLRVARNKKAGVTSTTTFKDTQYEVDLNGFGAEMAFGRMCNLYPDFTTQIRSGGEDFHFHNGYLVDVKNCNFKVNGMYVRKGAEDKADVFVLMRGEFPTYQFLGYTTTEDIVEKGYEVERTFGDKVINSYYLKKELLYQIGQTNHFTRSELS